MPVYVLLSISDKSKSASSGSHKSIVKFDLNLIGHTLGGSFFYNNLLTRNIDFSIIFDNIGRTEVCSFRDWSLTFL